MFGRCVYAICGVVLAALLVPACSSSGSSSSGSTSAESSSTFVCDNRSIESRCFDYWAGATHDDVAGTCDGKVIGGPCPRDGAVGTCSVTPQSGPAAGKQITGIYYSGGPRQWTADSTKADCATLKGKFAAP